MDIKYNWNIEDYQNITDGSLQEEQRSRNQQKKSWNYNLCDAVIHVRFEAFTLLLMKLHPPGIWRSDYQ